MKSITFLLTGLGLKPIGGFKVVFEYANRLINQGFDVHIVFPCILQLDTKSPIARIKYFIKILGIPYLKALNKSWFKFDSRIKKHYTFSLDYKYIPKTDYYVATGVQTAYILNGYDVSTYRCLYLIQDFENWGVSEEYVFNSYKLGFKNIVISNWLGQKVKNTNAKYSIIKNGFDFKYFRLTIPIEEKNKFSVAMLFNNSKRKGCVYGLQALKIVKEQYPEFKAVFFGVPSRPKELPDWIEYYETPDKETHNKIYNESAIYLAPSLQEGWGLTVGEAMICGAAIVCTDTLGFQEMVVDGESALISPIKDSQSLARNIISLIEDDDLRIKLATTGNRTIQSFTWDNSINQFVSLMEKENTIKILSN